MSDEVYDAAGDISRYLQAPSLESQHVLALPFDGEPVAAHVVWTPQQHVPPVQWGVGGVAIPTAAPAPPPNLSMAFGNDDVQNHHAMAIDVLPPQGQYCFPADRVQAQAVHSSEPTLDHSVLPDLLGTMSLDDAHYSMDDDIVEALFKSATEDAGNNGSSAVAEHSVLPVEEDLITFVKFAGGQLDCSKCRSVREVLHKSANHKVYFIVHVGDPAGRLFQHAIIDRAYIDASGQKILNELLYADLRGRTHGCVQNFITNCVEMLKNDTSGQLTDSCSTSHANSDKHIELELAMLKEILSAPSSNTEAVGLPHSGPEAPHQTVTWAEENTNAADTVLNAANWPVFSPTILDSSQVSVQDGTMASSSDASATNYKSQLAKQRRRISQLTVNDIAKLMHMSKKDAAKELNISMTSLKRLCRKIKTDRWPARQIKSLDCRIKMLQQAAVKNVGTGGLFAIMEKMDKLKSDKTKVYASILKDTARGEPEA